MRPFFIGIAGPSGSGKTELAVRVAAALGHASVLNLDSYYLPLTHLTKAERDQCDFDSPEMLDWPVINTQLRELSEGRAIERPVYSFETHARKPETERLEPARFIVVEGIFALHDADVRAQMNLCVYVRTPDDICFGRRMSRDVVERGRSEASVRDQYERTVRPGAVRYVCPTERFAGLVVSGTQDIASSVRQVLSAIPPEKRLYRTLSVCRYRRAP